MDQAAVINRLRHIVGPHDVLTSRADCAVYGYDASVFLGQEVLAVVFPETTLEVAQLGGKLLEAAADEREGRDVRGVPVPLDDLR